MTVDVVVLVPMLGRAHTIPALRESLYASTDRARILWLVTHGDRKVLQKLGDDDHLALPPRRYGDYAAKMNAGYWASTEPLIFLGACDIRFHPGWLEACQPYVDAGFGVVGTNDLSNPRTATGSLSTHTLVTRAYVQKFGTIDQPNTLLHDGYWHEYVDDEFCATAKARGQWAHAPDAHVEHLHPDHGKRPRDGLDDQRPRRMAQGRRVFRRRRHLWT